LWVTEPFRSHGRAAAGSPNDEEIAVLDVAVIASPGLTPDAVVDRLRHHARRDPAPLVSVVAGSPGSAGEHHLVIGVSREDGRAENQRDDADVWVADLSALDRLWHERIQPFAANVSTRRRAPRLQQAVLVSPDPDWPKQAKRLIARLRHVTAGRVHRIDHVGSTAVPGLPAKDIVDIQVVVDDLQAAVEAAANSSRAGFVHVVGPFYGIDRYGGHHDEQVAVDADPGRPVNVHFHPVASPLWVEMLLLRDWLRADPAHRDEYAVTKRRLAIRPDHNVDDYSLDKMPWISQALGRALAWRAAGTRPSPPSGPEA